MDLNQLEVGMHVNIQDNSEWHDSYGIIREKSDYEASVLSLRFPTKEYIINNDTIKFIRLLNN